MHFSLFAISGLSQLFQGETTGSKQITLATVGVTLATSIVCSYAIALVYRITYRGKKQYSRNFAQSIILLGVLVSLVIAMVGNSVARAFGIFGALSIVRYRVPMRDPKDVTYILASVVIGLACGVGEWIEAGFATVVLVALLGIMHWSSLGLGPADDEKKKRNGDPPADSLGAMPPAESGSAAADNPVPADDNEHHKKKHKKHDKN